MKFWIGILIFILLLQTYSKNAAADRGYLPPACVSDET